MLYDQPAVYDAQHGAFEEDIPFYVQEACEVFASGGAVVELACGTGRVTVPMALAAAGDAGPAATEAIANAVPRVPRPHLPAGSSEEHEAAAVTGVDLSSAMLEAARARAAAAAVVFVCADRRDFARPGRYALCIVPLHSFSHLLTRADIGAALQSIRTSLRPGGRLILALHNPSPSVLARDPEALFPVGDFAVEGVGTFSVYERTCYDSVAQVLNISWYYEFAEHTEVSEFALRMFFPAELVMLLEHHGFDIDSRYGWYDRSPLTSDSGTQIVVCHRAC